MTMDVWTKDQHDEVKRKLAAAGVPPETDVLERAVEIVRTATRECPYHNLRDEIDRLRGELVSAIEVGAALKAEQTRLEALLNAPEILDFAKAVQLEAAHQRQRWGTDHDAGKTDADWFWLIGFLAGKALHNPPPFDPPGHRRQIDEKQLHRIITIAAAAANWHAAKLGATNMRPGIETPAGEAP